jgi:hypothetical protein
MPLLPTEETPLLV